MGEDTKRCDADEHFYDAKENENCPYCTDDESTVAISKASSESKKSPYDDDEEKTKAYWTGKKQMNKPPVLGWLVVMEGKGLGQDFRIAETLSSVGRDESNDIVIDNLDEGISRKKHCLIEYDIKKNAFYIERGENNTYLNDERVTREGKELKRNDMIEIGNTKLIFVPFCVDEFSWK